MKPAVTRRPVILWRGREFEDDELKAAESAGFLCESSRMNIMAGDLVVGRYACLPFYKELAHDVYIVGAELINSYQQHVYIADMINWYEDLKDMTPKTWWSAQEIPLGEDGPFFIKGRTNSRKFNWNTHCFAKDRSDVGRVIAALNDDQLISQQGLAIRKFEQLHTFGYAIGGTPITMEYRFFIAYGEILTGGYYWSSHVADLNEADRRTALTVTPVMYDFVRQVIEKVGDNANAYVVDIGLKQDGTWMVVELNDLQQSGLSENSPAGLYSKLYSAISRHIGRK